MLLSQGRQWLLTIVYGDILVHTLRCPVTGHAIDSICEHISEWDVNQGENINLSPWNLTLPEQLAITVYILNSNYRDTQMRFPLMSYIIIFRTFIQSINVASNAKITVKIEAESLDASGSPCKTCCDCKVCSHLHTTHRHTHTHKTHTHTNPYT